MNFEKTKGDYLVTTDAARLDIDLIHSYLTQSYWARGVPKDVVQRGIEHSVCFGLYDRGRQIGFARVITDQARFAYVLDVFVLDGLKGRGLGTWLMECIMEYLAPFGITKMMLTTSDAHEFYRKFGFTPLHDPRIIMEALFPKPWLKLVDPGGAEGPGGNEHPGGNDT